MMTLCAVVVAALSACQKSQLPNVQRLEPSWRVVESIGEARVERHDALYAKGLRSGDRIGEGSRVVTGRHAQLIIAGDDLQIIAGSHSALILGKPSGSRTFSHEQGNLSVRLSSSADDERRIATPHLIASARAATFDLQVDEAGTSLDVVEGQVMMSAADGTSHAILAAGASARLGRLSNGELQVRQAAGEPFRSATAQGDGEPREATEERRQALSALAELRKVSKDNVEAESKGETIILPASSKHVGRRPCVQRTGCPNETAKQPQEQISADIMPLEKAGGQEQRGRANLVPATKESASLPTLSPAPARTRRQRQFDALTDGLLDNLPIADERFR